jgi:nucleotide-binding universal stress UspA family protein
MTYKTLLVHLDYGERTDERTDIAIELAQRFTAHLTGLAPAGSPLLPYTGGADAIGAYAAEVMQELSRLSERTADRFKTKVSAAGLMGFDVRACEGDAVYALRSESRYADLVVVGQTDKAHTSPAKPNDLPEAIALGAGRPVLIVPYVGKFSRVGRRILLLWNESREAARAVSDAMPLLRTAEQVNVILFADKGEPTTKPGGVLSDIGIFLSRHSANVSVAREVNVGTSIGEAALSRAADHGSDLIVMGGYGHTRLREWVLGGASRSILDHMTVPVLMSH